jgi:hypothetical protein
MLRRHGADFTLKTTDGKTPSEVAAERGATVCSAQLGSSSVDDEGVPGEFLDPITLDLMEDPVQTAAGQIYERASIEQWFAAGNRSDPMTNAQLASVELTPCADVKECILAFKVAFEADTAAQ